MEVYRGLWYLRIIWGNIYFLYVDVYCRVIVNEFVKKWKDSFLFIINKRKELKLLELFRYGMSCFM